MPFNMLRLAPWYLHVLHPYAAGFLQRLPVLRLLAVHCAFRLGSDKMCFIESFRKNNPCQNTGLPIFGGGGNYSSFVLTPAGSPSLCFGAVSRFCARLNHATRDFLSLRDSQ